jgi:hypothetical protein
VRRGRKTRGLPLAGQAAQLPKEANVKFITRVAMATTALALAAGPAFAQQPEGTPTKDDNPGAVHQPATTPTQDANPGTSHKLAAPGVYCKEAGASKRKAEGQKKSPFAECVVGQAKARKGKSAREACKGASKKHVKGQKRTSFATCVVAAKNVSAGKKAQEESAPAQS